MTKYATLETRSADLATPFGLDWATKVFGAEAIASLPIRQAGKNKGAPKGHIIWRKAATAGYCRECQHAVAVGALVDAWIGASGMTLRSDAMRGNWLGRVQSMAAARVYLFEDGRARWAAEQEVARQDLERQMADADKRDAERAARA